MTQPKTRNAIAVNPGPSQNLLTSPRNVQIKPDIDAKGYQDICSFLEAECGIRLGNNKQYLVRNRLMPLMKELEQSSLTGLLKLLNGSQGRTIKLRLIDAMTTNETLWFRDQYPYEFLKEVILPGASDKKSFNLWSAACSSGQEPYSISMVIQEYFDEHKGFKPDTNILATDISSSMNQAAKNSIYDDHAISRGLSPERKKRFFTKTIDNQWVIGPTIRKRVRFLEMNLLKSFAFLGNFDVVFCRNVLIYFSTENKSRILTRIHKAMVPGGYLLLGASETLPKDVHGFRTIRYLRGIIYQKI